MTIRHTERLWNGATVRDPSTGKLRHVVCHSYQDVESVIEEERGVDGLILSQRVVSQRVVRRGQAKS